MSQKKSINKKDNKMRTRLVWINRMGERREHSLSYCTKFYAMNYWRENIEGCQGILSIDERRNSKLRLLEVINCVPQD
jgi:hypothetical protein